MKSIKRARSRIATRSRGLPSQQQCHKTENQQVALDLIESGEEYSMTGYLSDDCITQILRNLSTRFLLSSPVLVCRRWRRLGCSHSVLELLPSSLSSYKEPWGSLREDGMLELVRRHASTLEKVSLHGLKNLRSDAVMSIVSSLPRLQEFAVISCPLVKFTDLEGIVQALPSHLIGLDFHVDHLLICDCHECLETCLPVIHPSFIHILQKKFQNLQKLDLDLCCHMSTECLDCLLLAIPNIRSLNLHSHVFGWPEVSKILRSCASLQHLSIVSGLLIEEHNSSDEEEDIGLLGSRGRLGMRRQILFGTGFEQFNLGFFVPVALCSIRLYSSPHRSVPLDSTPLSGLLKYSGQQLRHLHAQSLYNRSWHVISVSCANLQTLDLSHARAKAYEATGIEEVVICGLLRLSKALERIGLPSGTDRILVELGRFCPKLREIHFEGYGSINNMVPNNCRVTDRGAVALAEGCPDLQVVSLAGCAAVSIASIRALAFHCKGLKVLLLPGCMRINDHAVAAIVDRFCKSLLVLDLTGCKITLTTIKHLLQHVQMHGTSLRVLAVSRSLWKSTTAVHSELLRCIPSIRALSGSSGLPWDGFYGFKSIHTVI